MDLSSELTKILWPATISFTLLWTLSRWFQGRKFPPGPFRFPIIGNFQLFTNAPHKVLVEYGKKYGGLIGIRIFTKEAIVINDCDTAKQILSHPATFARPIKYGQYIPGVGGFGGFSGENWHDERKLIVSIMKTLGMGKGEWEIMIHNETEIFNAEIESWNGKPIDFMEPLEFSIVTNFISLLVGRRISNDENKTEAKISLRFIRMLMAFMAPTCYAIYLPDYLKILLRWLGNDYMNQFYESMEDFDGFLRAEIKMSASNLSEKPTLITYYLKEIESLKKQNINHKKYNEIPAYSVDALVGDISSLFLGGVDTVRVSLHWMMLLLAAHPDVQEKIHAEIDAVAGEHKIHWDERHLFPYTMATMCETERWVAVTPFYIPRHTYEPMKVGDYVLPEGTGIVINWWAMTRDEKYFKDGDDFKPERFLNSDKDKLKKLDAFIPFSFGKRSCPGKHIGMMTMFLYITSILQKFRLVPPEGKEVSFNDMGIGATRNAVAQELRFIKR